MKVTLFLYGFNLIVSVQIPSLNFETSRNVYPLKTRF